MKKFTTRDLILSGILLALGIIIPLIFHAVGGMAGSMLLPMHIPVLIGGFMLPPLFAFLLGLITPLLNSIFTGMPPMFPMALIMMFELGTYGLVAALAVRKLRLSSIPSLIISMISGRVIAGIIVFILSSFFGVQMNAFTYVKGAVVTGLPGIVIQLILIPSLMQVLGKNYKVGTNN